MYRRFKLLDLQKQQKQHEEQWTTKKANIYNSSNIEIMPLSVDWDNHYRLQPSSQGLASCAGLDEEELIIIQQNLLDAASSKHRSPVLLSGPSGSGKTHLISCLAVECSTELTVLRIPAQVLLNSDGETRRLFQHLQASQRRTLLAIDNLELLLGGGEVSAASRVLSELTDNLLTSSRQVPVILATQKPWQLMEEQPRLRQLFQHSSVNLSRPPDRQERKRVLSGLVKRPDIWTAFQGSLRPTDFHGNSSDAELPMIKAIVNSSEGMSPRDLLCVLHQAANYPIRRLVYDRVRLVDEADKLLLGSNDINHVLAECGASVEKTEWSYYQQWASSFGSDTADTLNS